MDKQVVFKTAAIGGFDKKSVLDYVYSLTQKSEEAHAKLEEQFRYVADEKAAIQEQIESVKAESSSVRQEIDNIRAELEGERRRTLELTELAASKEEEIGELKHLVEERTRQMDDYIKRSGEVSEKNKELEKTKLEVEQASAQIGKLIIESHTEAQRIVNEAQDRAGEIIEQAKQKADEVLMDSGAQAQAAINDAKNDARRMTDAAQKSIDRAYERFSVFRGEISKLQSTMVHALEEMHNKAGQLSAEIDDAQTLIMNEPIETHELEEIAASYAEPDAFVAKDFTADVFTVSDTKDGESASPANPDDSPFFRYAAEE